MSETETPSMPDFQGGASPAPGDGAQAQGSAAANPEHAGPERLHAPAMNGLAARLRRGPQALRLLGIIVSATMLVALLSALLNGSRTPANATKAPPTATPIPSPTAMHGYLPLVDTADGFAIQYPLDWTCTSSNPGIDCIDSPDAQTYRLQVQLPGAWTSADTSADPNSGSAWVDYALGAFSDVPGRTYERLSDTSQSVTIGGATWQSGAAIIGIEPSNPADGSATASATPAGKPVRIRIQVYATVHDNRPYIIALYAAEDQFSTGSGRYFQPMLKTFAFLASGNEQ